MLNPEVVATVVAAAIAIAAGFRKAKGLIRDDDATNTVVEMLRAEVLRNQTTLTAVREDRDALLLENAKLRTIIEARDRDHHICQMTVNRLTFQLEKLNERSQ